jgi:hypothetical protein
MKLVLVTASLSMRNAAFFAIRQVGTPREIAGFANGSGRAVVIRCRVLAPL